MSRSISATNLTEINAAHLHEVLLVKLEFDSPLYVHSGVGTIVFDSNSYLGVGQFGNVSNTPETEHLRPTSLTLQLSGVDATLITEGLDAGNFGDVVTLYIGYRQDDGTLVDDPFIVWRGTYDHASITQGDENIVSIVLHHDLAILDERHGGRYTDEDQQSRFTGDVGFEFVTDMAGLKLTVGGRSIVGTAAGAGADSMTRTREKQPG